MSREKSQAILYRMVKYSDSSAIAMAFSRDFGKLKLFIPKAYTKKGGVMTFIPGNLDFGKKDSDLSRYYSFEPDTAFYKYLNSHEIVLRLHLLFEIYDGLYQADMPDDRLYELMLKIDDENYRKITPYIIYFMLRRAGLMYDTENCANCSSDEDIFTVASGGMYCPHCTQELDLDSFCDRESAYIIRCFGNAPLYKALTINRKQEIQILTALGAYASTIFERPLKSLKTILDII
ncbi:DNA repair protein RecO [Seleniivibrio woodruffii]|uniref:DNA repair protein RecO n=1 Tax=Seleniivibrio woodruffii TaxID=1078050 RepID=A0A4R1K8N9_9BACT|nr:DNA repair protein RecO [Seleniivibrio woodruffii]TCK60695.1 DNA replication and repair protein RecO [Seleniivibrio woodruffii]TVZ36325.1 DNA replication and repair protein RecO [Seleniivibrio woodruffii]